MNDAPPHSVEAEQALLGSMILSGRARTDTIKYVDEVLDVIDTSEALFLPQHRRLFEQLVELYQENGSIDSIQLEQRYGISNDLLLEVVESVAVPTNAKHYAEIVQEQYRRRQLLDVAHALEQGARSTDIQSLVEGALAGLERATGRGRAAQVRTIDQLCREASNQMIMEEVDPGLSWTLTSIDRYLMLKRGHLIFIGARPGQGKSALIQQVAEQMAKMGTNSVIFTLEQTSQDYALRSLSRRTEIDSMVLERHKPNEEREDKLIRAAEQATEEAKEAKVWIEDIPAGSMGLTQLKQKARSYVLGKGCRVIWIDYIQLMRMDPKVKRYEAIGEIAAGMLELAKSLDVTVISASQLSRPDKTKTIPRPKLSDLRDSGNLEEYANAVILLHRDTYYKRGDDYNAGAWYGADIIIAKNKGGPTGTAKLAFREATTSFNEDNSVLPF